MLDYDVFGIKDKGKGTQDYNLNSKEKLKPCCACPKTKEARDKCIIENGEGNCLALIQAHKECMRKLGFNI